MRNKTESAILFDVMISCLLEEGGISKAKQCIRKHLLRAKKRSDKETIQHLSTLLETNAEDPQIFVKAAINSISQDDPLANAYFDIFTLWEALLDESADVKQKWHRPWIVMAYCIEKFKGGKRSIYQGMTNQLRGARALQDNSKLSGFVVSKKKALEFLSQGHVPDHALNKIPELCYISAPILQQDNVDTKHFFSSAIWPVEYFEQYMTSRQLNLLEQLRTRQRNSVLRFEPVSKTLFEIVRSKMAWQASAHNISIEEDLRSAHYSPSLDKIRLPHYRQYTSEIEYYATWIHELAHSTMKILARDTKHISRDRHTAYAIEEVIAETCAFLAVKQLETEITASGLMNVETEELFLRYYNNSTAYINGWRKGIKEPLDAVLRSKFRNQLIRTVMKDVYACHITITNGTIFGNAITRNLNNGRAYKQKAA